MMDRYLLFAGDRYYPLGGWEDLKGEYPSVEKAKDAFLKISEEMDATEIWGHLVRCDDLAWNIILYVERERHWVKGNRVQLNPKWGRSLNIDGEVEEVG